jgi:hypothetical protein
MPARDQRQHRISRRSLVPLHRITRSVRRYTDGSGKGARTRDDLGFREGDRKPVSTAEALDKAQHSLWCWCSIAKEGQRLMEHSLVGVPSPTFPV